MAVTFKTKTVHEITSESGLSGSIQNSDAGSAWFVLNKDQFIQTLPECIGKRYLDLLIEDLQCIKGDMDALEIAEKLEG